MRKCTQCQANMLDGYVIEDGFAYYCSDDCLEKNMSRQEYEELHDDGEGSSYWTEWELEEDDEQEYLEGL